MTTTTHPAEILVERLHPDAKLPVRATEGDAGADLHAAASAVVYPGGRGMIGTAIAVAIPEGYVGYIKPRSGLAAKQGINVLGGVIDAGYRGEIKVMLHNTDQNKPLFVGAGDRIAQLVIQPVALPEFRESIGGLPESVRGVGGFGSTGAGAL